MEIEELIRVVISYEFMKLAFVEMKKFHEMTSSDPVYHLSYDLKTGFYCLLRRQI